MPLRAQGPVVLNPLGGIQYAGMAEAECIHHVGLCCHCGQGKCRRKAAEVKRGRP
jgi:hypothetical protein